MQNPLINIKCAVLVVACLLPLSQSSSHAREKFNSVSGSLLIASPAMVDSRFVGAVIYVYEHTKMGALGIVINRPILSVSAEAIAEQFEIFTTAQKADIKIFWGGPVQAGRGFILHSSDYLEEGSTIVHGGIAVTSSERMLKAILEGGGPSHSIFALGCAGWAPGQLDRELFREDWLTLRLGPEYIFGENHSDMWETATKLYTIDL